MTNGNRLNLALQIVLIGGLGVQSLNAQSSTSKQNDGFVLFELFTSEGCSSCPSADQNLADIADRAKRERRAIYTLSYHVDYWNRLGWTDPYSNAQFTRRQQEYAQGFKSDRVYTPQMVVNGVAEFVGSNREVSAQAIRLALKQPVQAKVAVSAKLNQGKVDVSWSTNVQHNGDRLNIALVQNHGQQQVTRGENASRRLRHVNIVRHLESIASPSSRGEITLPIPKNFSREGFHIVAFLAAADRQVRGANRTEIR